MTDSAVGLLPAGASEWSAGRVLALSGTRILAGVRSPTGAEVQVVLDLRVDARSGTVTGTLTRASASASASGQDEQ